MNLLFKRIPVLSWMLCWAAMLPAQVVINEYSASNLTQYQDNFGKYEDWFELYNTGTTAVNLGGYYLSDDSLDNLKYQIPNGIMINPGSFRRFWASGRGLVSGNHIHTSFKLSQTKNNSEFVVLSNPSGQIVDYVKLSKKTHLGHSRGRTLDGAAGWSIFTSPTPNASNNTATPYFKYADRPDMSHAAGYYTAPFQLALSTTEPDIDIHYTLDGTLPTLTSPIYTGPININATKVVKAVSFSSDPEILPSLVEFNTFFINVNHTVVVVSIAGTDLNTLANGNSSLEPHGSFEYFNLDRERSASTYGEYNKHGQDSWANSHRSIDFISRDEMAYNHSIEEFLFNWSTRKNFQRIMLRAAGDDNYPADHHPANEGSAHMRDAYVHTLSDLGGLHLDVRRSEKAVAYLNGQYWGVYDIRERCDDHDFTEYYYGQDKYELQYNLLWGSTWAEYGGAQSLSDWYNFRDSIMDMDMTLQSSFDYMDKYFDYKSLVDYVVVNSLTVCTDWLNWNVGWWRGLDTTGGHRKWGYILWDNDATFGHYINYTNVPNTTPQANPCQVEGLSGGSDPGAHMALFNKIRTNPKINRYYINRQIDLWNTVFSCSHMISQLDSMKALIDPEMPGQAQRWAGTYSEWLSNYQQLRDFVQARCQYLSTGFINCYNLTGPFDLVINVDPPNTGSVILNSLPIYLYPWSGTYFGNIQTDLTAYANAGYVFDHWSSNGQTFSPSSASDTVTVNLLSSDTITAHFSLWTGVDGIEPAQPVPVVRVYPTATTGRVAVEYKLPAGETVCFSLLSVLGSEIMGFTRQHNLPAGQHTEIFDLDAGLAPGLYFLSFTAGPFRQTFKIVYSPR